MLFIDPHPSPRLISYHSSDFHPLPLYRRKHLWRGLRGNWLRLLCVWRRWTDTLQVCNAFLDVTRVYIRYSSGLSRIPYKIEIHPLSPHPSRLNGVCVGCPAFVYLYFVLFLAAGLAISVSALLLLKKGFDFGTLVVFINFVGGGLLICTNIL